MILSILLQVVDKLVLKPIYWIIIHLLDQEYMLQITGMHMKIGTIFNILNNITPKYVHLELGCGAGFGAEGWIQPAHGCILNSGLEKFVSAYHLGII